MMPKQFKRFVCFFFVEIRFPKIMYKLHENVKRIMLKLSFLLDKYAK